MLEMGLYWKHTGKTPSIIRKYHAIMLYLLYIYIYTYIHVVMVWTVHSALLAIEML